MKTRLLRFVLLFLLTANLCVAQVQNDSTKKIHHRNNVIRYNLSGALLFGMDKYVVLGYERVIGRHQSISVNFGKASLPALISISTDSLDVRRDRKNSGFNFSVDYRFYLAKENRYRPPHGLYIGPYYSLSHFKRDNRWEYKSTSSSAGSYVDTQSTFNISTVGFELGYQFVLWKRITIDLVMIGPGLGFYRYQAKFDDNVDPETKEQLLDGLEQILTQKFPGMNFVFSDEEINSKGVLKINSIGYRYLVHIGFNF